MFALNGFVDISNGRPGMLIPLLSSSGTNLPYVQQMDEFLIIKEVIPYLEYENYPFEPPDQARSVAIGDRGLVAFRSVDDKIVCGNTEEILEYVANNRDLIKENLLLCLQLGRIEATSLEASYDVWRDLAKSVFDSERQQALWLDSEHRLFKKQQQIWDEIDGSELREEPPSRPGLEKPLPEYDGETLLRWLSNRGHFFAKGWTTVWHYVNARMPFEDRVSLLGIAWMYAVNEEDADFEESKSILFALFYRSGTSKDINWSELGQFVADRLLDDPPLILSFLKPSLLFDGLVVFLAFYASVDSVLKIISYSIQNLPKEPYVLEAMSKALGIVLADYDSVTAEGIRDFEVKDVQVALSLRKEVAALYKR